MLSFYKISASIDPEYFYNLDGIAVLLLHRDLKKISHC